MGDELALGTIPFSIAEPDTASNKHTKPASAPAPPSQQFIVRLGLFDVPLDETPPAIASGWIADSGYSLSVSGDARVSRALQVAHSLGLRAPQPAAEGTAHLDLNLAGNWSGFAPITVTGHAHLHDITARMAGVSAPLRIASATAVLTPDTVKLQNLSASFADVGPRLTGSVALSRQCDQPSGCPAHFELHADELIADELDQLLNPRRQKHAWYQILTGADTSLLTRVRAEGHFSADRFVARSLDASHLAADVQLEHGKLRVLNLRAEVLGGHHTGEWHADFTTKPPLYTGRGTLDKFSLGQLSDVMHDAWATGTASLSYEGSMSGWTAAEMFSAAIAAFQFDWRQGALRHLALENGVSPLHVQRFAGQVEFRDRVFTISAAKLVTPAASYAVTGSAKGGPPATRSRTVTPEISAQTAPPTGSIRVVTPAVGARPAGISSPPLDIELSLKLTRDSLHQFNVTGTLANPRVVPIASPAEASLKP